MFFSRKNKGDPANVLLLYHGVVGQGMASFKAFPGAFLGLEQAGSPHNLLACNCSLYFLLIFCISVVLVVISPLSFLILFESSVFSSW